METRTLHGFFVEFTSAEVGGGPYCSGGWWCCQRREGYGAGHKLLFCSALLWEFYPKYAYDAMRKLKDGNLKRSLHHRFA